MFRFASHCAAMPVGLGRRLRFLIAQFRRSCPERELDFYPEVKVAAVALEACVREHFPIASRSNVARGHRMGHPECSASARIKQLASILHWARKLKAMSVGKNKTKGNSITPDFLAKAALSWPSTCARSFGDSWRDLVGVGVAWCGRATITRIRDAFVEVLQDMLAR